MLLDYTYNESLEDLEKIYASGNAVSLLTCGKVKAFTSPNQYLRAGDAYIGDTFVKSIAIANHFAAPVFIFSAKHGIMSVDKRICDYNVTYRGTDVGGRVSTEVLAQQLKALQGRWIVMYGTKSYADRLLSVCPNLRMVAPFYGLRIGDRKAKNNRYLQKIGVRQ